MRKAYNHTALQPNTKQWNRGLTNLGNTCYMNSAIQALFTCERFREEVIKQDKEASHAVLSALSETFWELSNLKKDDSFKPKKLYNVARPSWFPPRTQQDSGEFLRNLLQMMHEEYDGKSSQADTYFRGNLKRQFECLKCGTISEVLEEYYDIPLDMPKKSPNETVTVGELLQSFLKPITLIGQVICDKCNLITECKQATIIKQYPHYLILNLMRFENTPETFRVTKNRCKVDYPTLLKVPESGTNHPASSKYALVAVVVHVGSTPHSGHYFCYGKHASNIAKDVEDGWYCFNDSFVSPTLYSSFAEGKTHINSMETSQLLIYEKITKRSEGKVVEHLEMKNEVTERQSSDVNGIRTFNLEKLNKTGLRNTGNTCYMNSVLQVLFMCDRFRNGVIMNQAMTNSRLYTELRMLFGSLIYLQGRKPFTPDKFAKLARPLWFEEGRQHDSSEFFRYLLDILHEEEKEASGQSIVEKLFEGTLAQKYTCEECRHNDEVNEKFYNLPLTIPFITQPNGYVTLKDMLTGVTEPEWIEVPCEKCSTGQRARKETNISVLPEYLILTMERFCNEWGMNSKNFTKVMYPLVIDLSFFKHHKNGRNKHDNYALMGVVHHSGNYATSGHYNSYARHEMMTNNSTVQSGCFEDKWYYFDDTNVYETNFKDFSECSNYSSNATSCILVYKRISRDCPRVKCGLLQDLPVDLIKMLEASDISKRRRKGRASAEVAPERPLPELHKQHHTVETDYSKKRKIDDPLPQISGIEKHGTTQRLSSEAQPNYSEYNTVVSNGDIQDALRPSKKKKKDEITPIEGPQYESSQVMKSDGKVKSYVSSVTSIINNPDTKKGQGNLTVIKPGQTSSDNTVSSHYVSGFSTVVNDTSKSLKDKSVKGKDKGVEKKKKTKIPFFNNVSNDTLELISKHIGSTWKILAKEFNIKKHWVADFQRTHDDSKSCYTMLKYWRDSEKLQRGKTLTDVTRALKDAITKIGFKIESPIQESSYDYKACSYSSSTIIDVKGPNHPSSSSVTTNTSHKMKKLERPKLENTLAIAHQNIPTYGDEMSVMSLNNIKISSGTIQNYSPYQNVSDYRNQPPGETTQVKHKTTSSIDKYARHKTSTLSASSKSRGLCCCVLPYYFKKKRKESASDKNRKQIKKSDSTAKF